MVFGSRFYYNRELDKTVWNLADIPKAEFEASHPGWSWGVEEASGKKFYYNRGLEKSVWSIEELRKVENEITQRETAFAANELSREGELDMTPSLSDGEQTLLSRPARLNFGDIEKAEFEALHPGWSWDVEEASGEMLKQKFKLIHINLN